MFLKYFVLLIIITATYLFFKYRTRPKPVIDRPTPARWYEPQAALFTPAEQHFMMSLEMAIEGLPVRLFGKTRIADLIRVTRGLASDDYSAAFSKIRSKHADFVLVHPLSFAPLLVIELDDSSHEADDRQFRDAWVDEAYAQAGLPILHVPLRKRYSEEQLRQTIIDVLRNQGV